MIELIFIKLFIASTLRPEVVIQDTYYPSGVKEGDSVSKFDKPASMHPLLKLDLTAYDSEYNKIEPGIYSVDYSPELNILLIGTGRNMLKSPVFQVINLNQKVYVPSAKIAFVKDNKIFIIYKNGNIEVQSFLYLPEAIIDK